MRTITLVLICGFLGLSSIASVSAAKGRGSHVTNWSQHDTAVYVVSTLNLLRTKKGHAVATVFKNRMGVRTYNVYADTSVADLYFIDLVKGNNSTVGTFAYKMGWQKPMSVSGLLGRFGAHRAPLSIVSDYQIDHKTLIGSFGSTLPS